MTEARHLCADCAEKEYEKFRHFCVHESMKKNEIWDAEYGGFDMPRWDYSAEDLTLTFSDGGLSKIVCPVIKIGTTYANSWQWSWGNKNADRRSRVIGERIKTFGLSQGYTTLSTLFLDADEYTGWACASMASHILSGQAVYRFAYEDEDEYFAYLLIRQTKRVKTPSP